MPKLKRKSPDQLLREAKQRISQVRQNETSEEIERRQMSDALHVSKIYI